MSKMVRSETRRPETPSPLPSARMLRVVETSVAVAVFWLRPEASAATAAAAASVAPDRRPRAGLAPPLPYLVAAMAEAWGWQRVWPRVWSQRPGRESGREAVRDAEARESSSRTPDARSSEQTLPGQTWSKLDKPWPNKRCAACRGRSRFSGCWRKCSRAPASNFEHWLAFPRSHNDRAAATLAVAHRHVVGLRARVVASHPSSRRR